MYLYKKVTKNQKVENLLSQHNAATLKNINFAALIEGVPGVIIIGSQSNT